MVSLLAELGADVNTRNGNDVTPAYTAAKEGNAEVLRVLARFKAVLTTADVNGTTPLNVAVANEHFDATKTLLLLGAPFTINDFRHNRQLRTDLKAWAATALTQHTTFVSVVLLGCTHESETTTTSTTTTAIPIPPAARGHMPLSTSEAPPVCYLDANAGRRVGAKVIVTYVTTVSFDAITTVVTTTRTSNPFLPMIAGIQEVLERYVT